MLVSDVLRHQGARKQFRSDKRKHARVQKIPVNGALWNSTTRGGRREDKETR